MKLSKALAYVVAEAASSIYTKETSSPEEIEAMHLCEELFQVVLEVESEGESFDEATRETGDEARGSDSPL